MANYSKEELSKARLQLEDIPLSMDILDFMPGLASLPYFNYDFSSWNAGDPIVLRNCIIRWINYFYSRELTCIIEEYPDYYERKAECARLAGFWYDPDTLQFKKVIKDMLEGKSKVVNRMIVSFLRHNYDDLYYTYVKTRDLHYAMGEQLSPEVGDDGIRKLPDLSDIKKFNELGKQLEVMRLDLLNNDTGKDISMALLMVIEEDKLKLSPETRAERTQNGESPLKNFDFYSKNYTNP